ncbi:MAG: hypothetical protein JNN11_04175 [Candidatus Doudnabacteria bacterium]|nr:hypothetical protein [Candidatus Doudnabacteria bacterium]
MIVISSNPKHWTGFKGYVTDDSRSAKIGRFDLSDILLLRVGAEKGENKKARIKIRQLVRRSLPGVRHAETLLQSPALIPPTWEGKCVIFPGTRLYRSDDKSVRYIYIRFDPANNKWVFGSCHSEQKLLPHFYAVVFKAAPRT